MIVRRTLGLDINTLWVNPVLLLSLSRSGDDGNEAGDFERQHVAGTEAEAERVEVYNECQSVAVRLAWLVLCGLLDNQSSVWNAGSSYLENGS